MFFRKYISLRKWQDEKLDKINKVIEERSKELLKQADLMDTRQKIELDFKIKNLSMYHDSEIKKITSYYESKISSLNYDISLRNKEIARLNILLNQYIEEK